MVGIWLVWLGLILLGSAALVGAGEYVERRWPGAIERFIPGSVVELDDDGPWDSYPDGLDYEPTDDDIYNGPGREGGIAYSQQDGRDEHDWSL